MVDQGARAPTYEMPRYRHQRDVQAVRIAAVEFDPDGSARIAPAATGYAPFVVGSAHRFREKFRGDEMEPVDLGYYVVHDYGRVSWSPTNIFEDDYDLTRGSAVGSARES
jgi:hypothetical protein